MAFQWIGKSNDGNQVTLKRFELNHFQFSKFSKNAQQELFRDETKSAMQIGAALDVETTGFQTGTDRIIEIGIRLFKFNPLTGEIHSLDQSYSALEDPGFALSDEIKMLTGISDEMVAGQKINWDQVDEILDPVQVIIAHNAGFDRPFVEKKIKRSTEKNWACSLKQIDWKKKGYFSSKLELLSIYHGFFTDSHRALHDVDALLYLLSFQDKMTQAPYLRELLGNAEKALVHVIASHAPFDKKDLLKARSYRWDTLNKHWSKKITKDLLPAETEWMEKNIYGGPFRGQTREILPKDRFKDET